MIQNYSDLLSALPAFLDGASTTSQQTYDGPLMVQLFESDVRPKLIAVDQEATIPFSTDTTALPADCDSIRSLSLGGTPNSVLEPVSPTKFANLPATQSGMPTMYLAGNGTISLWPAPDGVYTGTLTYRQSLPALSTTNPFNWLLAKFPNLYLYGSLLHAEAFGWNDERLPWMKAYVEDTIQSINMAAQRQRYGGGPLTVRSDIYGGGYDGITAW